MKQFRIDKNVPIETINRSKHKTTIDKMETGDSVQFWKINKARSFQTVINRHGFHSAMRKTDDGWRVWKLEQRDN